MKKFFVTALLLLLPLSSHALLEIRAGYGKTMFDEDTYLGQELDDGSGYNLDVIFEPPMLTDLGLGLRYEKVGFDIGSGTEADLTRIAALVNYRIIDFIGYLGFIGTVGISNKFETETAGTTFTDYDEKLNYTIGLEGGVNLGIFSIGAEVGKMFAEIENPGAPDIDLNSTYAKILFGIDI